MTLSNFKATMEMDLTEGAYMARGKKSQSGKKQFCRPLPKPPSPMPWFTLGSALVLWALYSIFQGWPWAALIALALVPFISALLPMEIREWRRRKRICDHIRRDFMEEPISEPTHAQFFEALHALENASPRPSKHQKPAWQNTASDYSYPSQSPW